MTLIPGAGEFVYEDRVVTRAHGQAASRRASTAIMPGERSDLVTALDDLEAPCPNLENVSLVVAWFGDDLRAGALQRSRPKVETRRADDAGRSRGASRASPGRRPRVVTPPDGRPAYGGTPTDESVVGRSQELDARGLRRSRSTPS